MKLADLRKLAIRRQFRIRFPLRNGMECVVNQRGVARVPALNGIPDFNLEEELSSALPHSGSKRFQLRDEALGVTLHGRSSAAGLCRPPARR